MIREIPELSQKVKSSIFIGEAIDNFIRRLVETDEKIKNDLEKNREFYSKKLKVDGETVTIIGKPDIVLKDEVIEIKYTNSTKDIPKKHHIQQLRIYLFLTGKQKGRLFYVTNSDFFEFKVNNPFSENEVVELYKTWKSPRYSWECNYCNFKDFCPVHSKHLKDKR